MSRRVPRWTPPTTAPTPNRRFSDIAAEREARAAEEAERRLERQQLLADWGFALFMAAIAGAVYFNR